MSPKRLLAAVDRWQQTHRGLAVAVAVIRKASDDQAGGMAAQVSYFAFFSLFPLLLALTTILGFVLHGDPSAQAAVKRSVLSEIPIIGDQIHVQNPSGSALSLVIGLAISLWAGLGVTNATQSALDRVWAVPFKDRPGFVPRRLRGLGLLGLLGVLFTISTVASGLVSGGFGGAGDLIAGWALSLVVNFGLFFLTFRLMTPPEITARDLWLGSACGGAAWTILQALGGYYVGHVLTHQSGSAGKTFGLVIALLVWLHLGAQLLLYSAELNVIVSRHLWPRSLAGPPQEPGDRRTLEALAKVEERSDQERVQVEFDHPPGSSGARSKPSQG